MKKVDLCLLLTLGVAAHCASYLIPSLHLSVTSKVMLLMLSSFVSSSVALLVILVLLDIWSITGRPESSKSQTTIQKPEKIPGTGKSPMTIDDEWEELHEKEVRLIIKSEELRERQAFMEFVTNKQHKGESPCLNS